MEHQEHLLGFKVVDPLASPALTHGEKYITNSRSELRAGLCPQLPFKKKFNVTYHMLSLIFQMQSKSFGSKVVKMSILSGFILFSPTWPLWAELVIESPCLSVCLFVCLCVHVRHQVQFFFEASGYMRVIPCEKSEKKMANFFFVFLT